MSQKKSKYWIFIVIIVIVLLAVFTAAWFFYFKDRVNVKVESSPSPAVSSSIVASFSPSPSASPTSTANAEKTIKEVHCLQKPAKSTNITVENLEDYSIQKSKDLTFRGKASVFENQFNFRLKDCRGPVIKEGLVEASGEMGNAVYNKSISAVLSRSPMDVILEVYENSAADGSEKSLTQVPLRLTQ
ncbi:MAG: hypothetical protein US94_C0020G0004 [Berkelbacteria bacterium GW2011_GWB1_38_5]|uniref:Bacterial spore germination immunoglobulin-like domain-containing protein n=2 Tax=Candidatus Berkelbacteria TaxID=1618330 RepID=A0A0G0PN16_9BACT|nr:MAG: hypothetical protein US94_C0020G0004 [Berkelbacteria bacterium GW2011_GWB1_38_5]KKQ90676.1 MAG: hypothetical protein UT15_C0007G0008 [Berkelbacteria bacterium GW2011_GWA1_39_10]